MGGLGDYRGETEWELLGSERREVDSMRVMHWQKHWPPPFGGLRVLKKLKLRHAHSLHEAG